MDMPVATAPPEPPVEAADLPRGRLELLFAPSPTGRTYIARQYAGYPFHLCRALHLSGDPPDMATIYVQSCAGGLYEHDRLAETIAAAAGAQAHVTTQASTIVHSMPRGEAQQSVTIEAGAGALLEYLPDPLILFPDARLSSRLRVRAHADATLLIADSFLCHDPQGKSAMFDWFGSEIEIADAGGGLLARDRFRITGKALAAGLPGIAPGRRGGIGAQGTLYVLRRGAGDLLDGLRQAVDGIEGAYAGVSLLPGECGAWLRVLAVDGVSLSAAMAAGWRAARRGITGRDPAPRRK